MVNHSKSRQQRFWNKWKKNGSVGKIDNYARYPGLKDKLPGVNVLITYTYGHNTGVKEHLAHMEKVDLAELREGDVIWTSEELNPSTGKVYGYEKQVIVGVNPVRYHQASIKNCSWTNTLRENQYLFTVTNPRGVLECLKQEREDLILPSICSSVETPINTLISKLEKELL